MALKDTFILKNGVSVPKIGLGTWQIPDGKEAYNSIKWALEAGYRHIDTAMAYGNEASVGRAIRDSGIPREEIFVTTKLPAQNKGYKIAHECFEKSLADLGLEYIDLYLIHAPWPWDQIGIDCTEGNLDSWRAFEEIYESGKVKAIGISNFEPKHIEPILAMCKHMPMVNQIRFHIGDRQEEVVDYCRDKDILITAYSPLATGRILNDKTILDVAEKYNASPAQICIKYCLQKDMVVIPKSTKKERIISNKELGFIIDDMDMKALDRL
ncbi:MAG: aldo/keto reductase [Clostridiales bacterium]|jgi:diketogulonate reductase-like aldo/keto reductase|nr:aldo/keto reductase [Bacillota bacterium]NLK03656.1 aldo/keto reductase [Clostridiales bacterium]